MFKKLLTAAWMVLMLACCQFAAAATTVTVSATPSNPTAPANVTLAVTATSDTGPVMATQVEYFNGATSLGIALQAPFTATVNDLAAGTYQITAKVTTTDPDNPMVQSPPLALSVGTPPGAATAYFIHTDQLDTPRVITNGNGAPVWQWDSDPFGKELANEQPAGQPAFVYNTRFPGQQFDRETNLHYNDFRDYDPAVARYLESDPMGLGGGINTFAYVENDPLRFSDPFGLFSTRDALGYVPVVGSALDAYDSAMCGNYGWAAFHAGLAIADATGTGALVKGLAVGTMRWGSRAAIRDIYASSKSWDQMRRGLQKIGEVARNSTTTARADWVTTDHIFFKQRSGLPHAITNHPSNLQTGVSQSLNSSFEHMGWAQRAAYLPAWIKAAAVGAGSYATGIMVDSGCSCKK